MFVWIACRQQQQFDVNCNNMIEADKGGTLAQWLTHWSQAL